MSWQRTRLGILPVLGLLLLVAAGVLLGGALLARQALESGQHQALAHAGQLSSTISELQARLGDSEIDRAMLAAGQADRDVEQALVAALRRVGLDRVLSVQRFDTDLESLTLGDDPALDFGIVQMLIEARRDGQAPPEVRMPGDYDPQLVLARRLGSPAQPGEDIVLVRLPLDAVVDRIDWSPELGFVALSQWGGERRTEFWSCGTRPGSAPVRTAVPDTRLSLDWHRPTMMPMTGPTGPALLAVGGLVLILLGIQLRRREERAASLANTEASGPARAASRVTPSETPPSAPFVTPGPPPSLPARPVINEERADDADPPLSLDPEFNRATPSAPPLNLDFTPTSGSAPLPEPPPPVGQTPDGSTPLPTHPGTGELGWLTDIGVLGRYEVDLDEAAAARAGRAIGELAAQHGLERLAVARDGRLHGPALMRALVDGLRAAGRDVLDLGTVPSPLLEFAAAAMTGHSCVMVSAGHLPDEWNGFGVWLQGQPLSGGVIQQQLERQAPDGSPGKRGGLESIDVIDRYLDTVTAGIRLARPLKVVVDCANGVTGRIAPRLLEAIGVRVLLLYAELDGAFPHHPPDPSRPENLEDLRLCVRNFRADLGLAIGGAGDSLVMVGPEGSIIWPDRLLMLLARETLARQPGALVIQDALCSPRVAAFVASRGGSTRVSELGTAAMWRCLQDSPAALGATFRGQFISAADDGQRFDALLTACRLLQILAADDRPVGDLLGELPAWFSLPVTFVATDPMGPEQVLRQLLESADVADATVSGEHGFTIDYGHAWTRLCRSPDGRGLLVRVEGDDEAAAQTLATLVRQMLLALDHRLQVPL